MECLFDPDKPHFAAWLQLYDVDRDLEASPLYFFATVRLSVASPLYYAALCGFQGVVENLIIKHPHLVNATGGYYKTPSLAALARRHLELARMLYRKGSSMDPRSRGNSPLHSAIRRGDSEIVQVLLDCKSDTNAKDVNNWTPLSLALMLGNWTPSHLEIIRLLLEFGADPNVRIYRSTPLHLASEWPTVEVARLLLKYGADVEAEDDYGRTAFQVASERGYDELAKLLSAHGTKDIS
jgi:ankyrin repeat protein